MIDIFMAILVIFLILATIAFTVVATAFLIQLLRDTWNEMRRNNR